MPVVSLRFAFPGGAAFDPAGRDGTASLVTGLLDEGAGPYDTVAYHRKLDELAAEFRFAAGQALLPFGLLDIQGLGQLIELLARLAQFVLATLELFLLGIVHDSQKRFRIAVAHAVFVILWHIVEERIDAVEISLRERVASGAGEESLLLR